MVTYNEIVEKSAKELGFNLVGFTEVDLLEKETELLNIWLQKNYHAGMSYMQKNVDKRRDVKKIFSNAKSVISLGMNYYAPFNHNNEAGKGKISRYAWGKDYHLIIWEKLETLISILKEKITSFEGLYYVDTGPVMDKAWAVRAGLGWLGKHSNVINKERGSWFFIANIFTNIIFQYNKQVEDFCGTCTACIDACPTKAIVEPYVVDANKCISYLTIENKGEIDNSFKDKFDNWIFGCDVCQDVCPWNEKFSFITVEKEFYPSNNQTSISLNEVLEMEQKTFNEKFFDSPIKRAKLKGLKRNAEFLI